MFVVGRFYDFDVRIREREFCGTFQTCELDRKDENRFGRFYWRPESGESPADCYDRSAAFADRTIRLFKD